MKKNYSLMLIALIMVLSGCSKSDDTNEQQEPTTTQKTQYSYPDNESAAQQFLAGSTMKEWQAARFNLSLVGTQTCRLDDKMTLFANGTYAYDNGGKFCGGDVNKQEGSWVLRFEARELVFDSGTEKEEVATIVDLTETSLQVTGSWGVYQISAGYQYK
jgi:hypothetical protein